MNDNVSFDNGQLFLNLAMPIDVKVDGTVESLKRLIWSLDYSGFGRSGKKKAGRPSAIEPQRMMTIIVYGYMNGQTSSRELEWFCGTNLVCQHLLGTARVPDHATFDRFIRGNHDAIAGILAQMVKALDEAGELDHNIVFQDGTKIESVAGRYSFVWLSALEKNIPRLIGHIREIPGCGDATEADALKLLDASINAMEERGVRMPEKTGRGIRNTKDSMVLKEAVGQRDKLRRYILWEEEMKGSGRNSLSKTDADATFMRMKEDHMRNGQLKPAYNVQNIVANGYVIGTYVSSDRTDYHTMVPAMDKLKDEVGYEFKGYCADSGYDCGENYTWLEKNKKASYIKTQTYETSKKRSCKADPSRKQNYSYDGETDSFTCMHGTRLTRVPGKVDHKGNDLYEASSGCDTCPFRKACMKAQSGKDGFKRLWINIATEKQRRRSEANFTTGDGPIVRVNRSIQAEGSFSMIKDGMGFRRFSYHGKGNCETQWNLLCIAANVLRFSYRSQANKLGTPQWFTGEEKKTA